MQSISTSFNCKCKSSTLGVLTRKQSVQTIESGLFLHQEAEKTVWSTVEEKITADPTVAHTVSQNSEPCVQQ